MPTVYLETTIPSYLASFPSRDLVIAAHQQITHEWWKYASSRFDLFTSELVYEEIQKGDSEIATRRLSLIEKIPVLKRNEEVDELISLYKVTLGLTGKAQVDVPHLAYAVAYRVDYLLTWNCAHLANGAVIRRLMDINARLSRYTPLIVTPDELLEAHKEQE